MEVKWSRLVEKHRNILIERTENFSLFFGGRGHINSAAEKACGALLLQPNHKTLIANNIEIYRLLEEEADTASEWEIRFFPWYADEERAKIIKELINGEPVVTDQQIAGEIQQLRTVLSPEQLKHARELGKVTAEGLEKVCEQIQKGMTEYEVAGMVSNTFLSQGIDPIVNLVGSDHRLLRYRHFMPTHKKIERHVIISIVTRYRGLAVSATRSVHFGAMEEDLKRKMELIRKIDAQLTANTKPGRQMGELFNQLIQWYADCGYANEWENHHQGGLAGYLPREERLLSGSTSTIQENQLYAWNPSLPGAKSEDTTLVIGDEPEVITWTGEFPYGEIQVDGMKIKKTSSLIR